MNKHTQAISFANSYFALIDGLASGLDRQLSEDVVLHWFGRTIRGRRNVCAFMKTHKPNSKHMFTRIAPTTGISYERKHINRKVFRSSHDRNNPEDLETENDTSNEVTCFRETEESSSSRYCDITRDINQNEIEMKRIDVMDNDEASYDLNEGDLSNLFKLEITSSSVEEIEQSINKIKLEEEMAPTVRAIKRERGEEDGTDIVETSAVKYVEADGEVEFSRKFWKRDTWNTYFSSTTNVHRWRRPCKLQIVYTTLTERQPDMVAPCESNNVTIPFKQPKVRLPSLEEINEISNRLIPNTNHFGGYLYNLEVLEELQADIGTRLIALRNLNNKLVLEKPCIYSSKNEKQFIFNYQIHLIIYEDRNERNASIPQEV
ncbi:hypothetical protein ANTPLA_LOCUS10290 [Anthophora plagiata]